MARRDGDKIVLSTGKTIYANCGILGISDTLEIFEGYDGGVEIVNYVDDEQIKLSYAERKELAEYVIGLWRKFAALSNQDLLTQERG